MKIPGEQSNEETMKIGIVGLGYVGLSLSCLFAHKYRVIGYDIDLGKIGLLREGIDYTHELEPGELVQKSIYFSGDPKDLKGCNVIIIAVPTDIDQQNQPDLEPLKSASSIAGRNMDPGTTIIFESTVYPGLTEEICIPILEKASGMQWKTGFNVGYSPERINPGDKNHPLHKIKKIVAGDTEKTLALLTELYDSVIEAGIYQAPDIRTAEAAKVIENAQRDLNIAFMNELAIIFDRLNLDTIEVIKAASTKWNFLPFEPGLVGGHCIGVDPYYLTYKAEQIGYKPQVIHSGRHLNNDMGRFIADKVIKLLVRQEKVIAKCRVLILGCSFKENISDVRNSKVFDMVKVLEGYHIAVDLIDPHAEKDRVSGLGYSIMAEIDQNQTYDAIILAVKHDLFSKYTISFLKKVAVGGTLQLFDVKGFYDREEAKAGCSYYWRL